MNEPLYKVSKVAEHLGINYATCLRYMREGKIRGYRMPAGWRVPESAVREYVEKYKGRAE